MAEIKLVGFVDDWTKNNPNHPDWAMRVSEPHRKKDGDNWVTVSRTNFTVKAAYDVTIDFTQFARGARVEVIGKQLTETSEKDGKRYDNLVVKAESVTVVDGKHPAVDVVKDVLAPAGWEPVETELPF